MTPEAKAAQRKEAHDLAMAVRAKRSDIKIALKALNMVDGQKYAADILAIRAVPNHMASWEIGKFLDLISQWSYEKATRFLMTGHINPVRRIGDLTIRERVLIVNALRENTKIDSPYNVEASQWRTAHQS